MAEVRATAPAADSAAAAAAAPQPWGETLSRRRIAAVIVAVMLGMLLSAVDQTVVGTAMPRIIADLNGLSHYAWVATAYLLASTASMPIWGKLSDAFGRKRFFILGMAIFMIGSALCGQANGMTELIAFRALQGLGAGAMMPISQAIIGDIFPPAQRARWSGVLMSVFAVATIIGPLLGGWITDNYSWRWVFYVNLPVGIAALTAAAVALPGHVSLHKHRIDYSGATLLVAAAVPLLLAFSWAGSELAWGSWQIISLFAFSGVMWVAFYLREMRAAEPVINPRLFQNSIFRVSALASMLQSAAMFGAIMFLPLFVQGVQGKSATNSGIILMPMMLGAMVTSIGAGQILAKTGRYKWLVVGGFACVTLGAFLLSRMGVTTSSAVLAVNMVVMGLGLGISMSSFTVIVQNQYPSHRLGEVTGGLQFFRSIGATVGMAIFGTILNNQFRAAMLQNLPAPLPKLTYGKGAALLDNPQVLLSESARTKILAAFAKFGPQGEKLFAQFMAAVRHSLQMAISDIFVLATIVGVAGLIVVLFLREDPLRRTHAMDPESGELESEAGPEADAQPEPEA
ncbi:MAG: MDR family MFS transporter [Actinobacteria bacterium]|nr:MDR family MFS transporter [Actinomycetota bacterium]